MIKIKEVEDGKLFAEMTNGSYYFRKIGQDTWDYSIDNRVWHRLDPKISSDAHKMVNEWTAPMVFY